MQADANNFVEVEIMQLTTIQVQVTTWKPLNQDFFYYAYFVVNDNLLVDLVNP